GRGAQGFRLEHAGAVRRRRQHQHAGVQGLSRQYRAGRSGGAVMTERAPQPTTAAANPPMQPLSSNLTAGDVVRASATANVPAPERALTPVAKLIDVSKCIGCKACQTACIEWNDTHPEIEWNTGVYENPHDLTPDMFT